MFDTNKITNSYEWPDILNLLKSLDIHKYPAICAGGFPRDVGLGTYYNDIDIFVQTKDEKCEQKVKEIFDKCYISRDIRPNFQLICVPCDDIVQYINDSFDFTCCSAYIDKDGKVHPNKAQRSCETKRLELMRPLENQLDNIKTIKHCLRLAARGWLVDINILSKLLKTLVPIVGSQTYVSWKTNQETLSMVLTNELNPERLNNRPIVSMVEYGENVDTPAPIEQTPPSQTPTPPYTWIEASPSFQNEPAILEALSRALNANPGR